MNVEDLLSLLARFRQAFPDAYDVNFACGLVGAIAQDLRTRGMPVDIEECIIGVKLPHATESRHLLIRTPQGYLDLHTEKPLTRKQMERLLRNEATSYMDKKTKDEIVLHVEWGKIAPGQDTTWLEPEDIEKTEQLVASFLSERQACLIATSTQLAAAPKNPARRI